MMRELTYTQRLADTIRQFGGATAYQASAELLRLEARVAELEAQELARLHENGAKAWAFLGDRSASDWVDEIRGNERQDCEPVGTVETAVPGCNGFHVRLHQDSAMPEVGATLYAAPPEREPLSDEQIAKALASAGLIPEDYREDGQIEPFVRAIERAHQIGGQS